MSIYSQRRVYTRLPISSDMENQNGVMFFDIRILITPLVSSYSSFKRGRLLFGKSFNWVNEFVSSYYIFILLSSWPNYSILVFHVWTDWKSCVYSPLRIYRHTTKKKNFFHGRHCVPNPFARISSLAGKCCYHWWNHEVVKYFNT
jgi:hypothetical protein